MHDQLTCPHCKKTFPLDEALSHQLKKQFEQEQEKQLKIIEEKQKRELEEKYNIEMKDLKTQLEEKDKKVGELRDQELKLREEKRKIEEREKELELSVQRRVDAEKEEILLKASQEQRLKDAEKDKMIEGLKQSLEEAQRKANVGSQQLQGEVLELDLQNLLMRLFPQDLIEEIAKGVHGGDIRQTVKSPKGMTCGIILWECKRKKAWSDADVVKLKDDLRRDNADVGVIVSTLLPKQGKNGLCYLDGIWVCSFPLAEGIAIMIRKLILDVAYQKAVSQHRGEKADLLYSYVTSNQFQQQFEIMAEVYMSMKSQIIKERKGFEKLWAEREAQLERYINSAANIYGSMQGLVGSSMPQIKGFELFELESGKEK